MKLEISDTLASDFERLLKNGSYFSSDISAGVERLINAELRRSCAPGYETDRLTGCGSRFLLERDIGGALFGSGWNDRSIFTVQYLCLDVDDLRGFNELHGPREGDCALAAIANYLQAAYCGAKIYRTGGDEFVVEMSGRHYVPVNFASGVRLKHTILETRVQRNVNNPHAKSGIMFHLDLGMVNATEGEAHIKFDHPVNI